MSNHHAKREKPIYYGHQYIDEADIAAVVAVLKSDFLTCGPKIPELERRLCDLTGAQYAVAVSSGTAALHAACWAAGIGPGDEVIVPPMTFAASANCVLYCGGRPVFADIDPDTYNISPQQIEANLTPHTKAVVAVDFTGQAVPLSEIQEICKANQLLLIEDAAHSIGTRYCGRPVGGIADFTTFSFHPVKTVTGGEGGAVTTNDSQLYQRLMRFRAHGVTRDPALMEQKEVGDWYYEQIDLGYNYRLTDIQAALICSQLDKLEQFSARRKQIATAYDQAFSQVPGLILQKTIPESDTTRHLYLLRLDLNRMRATRRQIFEELKAENIYCNVHYIPTYLFPYYQKLGYREGLCPNAEALYHSSLTIPLYYSMTDEDVDYVIEKVKEVVGRHVR